MSITTHSRFGSRSGARGFRQRGFSLAELMIAGTLGLLILSSMVTVFVSTVQSRDEVDKSNRQIENGRFAIEMIREDVQLAAFYGDYMPVSITWSVPNPCSTILNNGFNYTTGNGFDNNVTDLGFTTGNVPVGIQGYPDTVTGGTEPGCLTNRKAGTDILVVRRVSTAPFRIDTNEDGTQDANATKEDGTAVALAGLGGGYYLQSSNCSDTPGEAAYVMAKTPASFILHAVRPMGTPPSCMNGRLADIRQFFVRIYYIATCNVCAGGSLDTIPTLKMVELTSGTVACMADPTAACGAMSTRSIAEGIENLQFEYGIDTNNDGTPDSYSAAPAATAWENVLAVKIFLLARNTETSPGYIDTKTYSLASDGSTLSGTPFNDQYRRHVYAATARAINIANRR